MKYAYLLSKADDRGRCVLVETETQEVDFRVMQKQINCSCIQIVQGTACRRPLLLVIDDEGKLRKKHVNIRASILYGSFYDCIVGDALIGIQIWTEDGPDWGPLPLEEAEALMDLVNNNLEDLERDMGKR